MSKPERISDVLRLHQWKTDEAPCEGLSLGAHTALMAEVRGDLGGESVTFLGGLTPGNESELAFLDEVRQPGIVSLPAIHFLLPVTKVVGVTITIRGLA